MPLITQKDIEKVAMAAINAGLNPAMRRGALLSSIDAAYAGLLMYDPMPMGQYLSDLGMMNQTERLASGQVPLAVYLRNLSLLLSGTQQQKDVLDVLDEVEHRTSGAPRIDVATLTETKEKIIHVNDMVPYVFMEQGAKAAAAVLKLSIARYDSGIPRLHNGNPMIYLGTGWLLTQSLVMTNHHVINARDEKEDPAIDGDLRLQAAHATCLLDYDADALAGTITNVQALEAWDSKLDYAIVRIPPTGRAPLRRCATMVQKNNDPIPVNIIQHPGGRGKRYGIRNNLVSASTTTDLRYFTDTEGGSSGSPVFNDQWEVVALHRASVPVKNVQYQGKDTAYVNLGTHLLPIISDISKRYPALAAEIGL